MKLQQKRAIRIIAGVPRFHSTDLLFKELKLLKFIHINKYLIGRLMFRICNHELQNLFGDLFTVNRQLHGHDTRQALHYHIPLFKTNLVKSCLRYYGAMIRNKIMSLKIPTITNEFLVSRTLKANIIHGLLWQNTRYIHIHIWYVRIYIYIYIYSFLVSAFAMECANASVFCLVSTWWFTWISNAKRVTWLNYTNIHDTIIRCHKVYARYSLMLILFARKTYVASFFSFFSCSNQCTAWFDKNKLSLVFQTRGP